MGVTYAKGFTAAGVDAGISASMDDRDLAMVVNRGDDSLRASAAVFTSNRFCAAPVQWTRRAVRDHVLRAVVLNSGGANACTGEEGYKQAEATAEEAARLLGTTPQEVAVCSTGLIGEPLPLDNVLDGIRRAYDMLDDTECAGIDAATAIMTTDTRPKTISFERRGGYRIGGMVKGAGMIAPQLATMLCVITTDAVVDSYQMQKALESAVVGSFDRIDVDGCMSTNDTVIVMASGASGVRPNPSEFAEGITRACVDLAQKIVGDAEGSTHDIRIRVVGASGENAALVCARAVAGSNLFKCAVAGNDPNWGRILSSIGTIPESAAPFTVSDVDVSINDVMVCRGGHRSEDRSLVDMTRRQVRVDINLHAGDASAVVWSNDLTKEYVRINSDYES